MAKAVYVRLYADAKGESHFSEEEMVLKSVNFAPPSPPVDNSNFTPAKHFVLFHTPPGWFGDWHPTPIDSSCSSSEGRWTFKRATAMSDVSGQEAFCSWKIQPVEATRLELQVTIPALQQ
jgi:hypothetical protein